MTDSIYCDVKEASRISGVKERTLYSWVGKRKFPHYKAFGKLLFKRAEVLEFIEGMRVEPADYEKKAKKMIGNSLGFRNNSIDSGQMPSQKRSGDEKN